MSDEGQAEAVIAPSADVDQVDQIGAALAKAQADMRNPAFDSSNPHFKSKFASLAAVRNAVIPVLAQHNISLCQDLQTTERGVSCTTILTHSSGQQMRFGPLELPASKLDAQGLGSAATYARRYSMMAVSAVVGDEDDDGNAAIAQKGMGAVKKRKYIEGLLEAVKNEDAPGLLQLWEELDNQTIEMLWQDLRSYERSAIKQLLEVARKAAGEPQETAEA